jgi:[protein-PII] uridylyltransferase
MLSPDHTVIELQALDRIGLLYDVFLAIGQLGLNIAHARINTEKGVALDSIYVQNSAGEKISDKQVLATLKKRLDAAVFA